MNEKIERLHAFIDGEVSPEERAEVLDSVQNDVQLSRELAWANATKDLIASKCSRNLEGADWKSAKARIRELDKVKTTNQLVTKYAWSICGVLVAGVLAAGSVSRNRPVASTTPGMSGIFSDFLPERSRSEIIHAEKDQTVHLHGDGPSVDIFKGEICAVSLPGDNMTLGVRDAQGVTYIQELAGIKSYPGVDQPYADGMKLGFVGRRSAISFIKNGYLMVVIADRRPEELVEMARRIH